MEQVLGESCENATGFGAAGVTDDSPLYRASKNMDPLDLVELRRLRDERTTLLDELDHFRFELGSLREEKERQAKEIKEWEAYQKRVQAGVELAMSDSLEQDALRDSLQEQLRVAENKAEVRDKELACLKEVVAEKEQQIKELGDTLAKVQHELDEQATATSTAIQLSQSQSAELKRELLAKLQRKEQDVTNLEGELQELKDAHAKAREFYKKDIEQINSGYQQELMAAVNEAVHNEEEKTAVAEGRVKALQDQSSKVAQDLKRCKSELDAMRKNYEHGNEAAKQATAKAEQKTREAEQASLRAEAATSRANAADERARAAEAERDDVQLQKSAAIHEAREARGECVRLRAAVAAAENEAARANRDAARAGQKAHEAAGQTNQDGGPRKSWLPSLTGWLTPSKLPSSIPEEEEEKEEGDSEEEQMYDATEDGLLKTQESPEAAILPDSNPKNEETGPLKEVASVSDKRKADSHSEQPAGNKKSRRTGGRKASQAARDAVTEPSTVTQTAEVQPKRGRGRPSTARGRAASGRRPSKRAAVAATEEGEASRDVPSKETATKGRATRATSETTAPSRSKTARQAKVASQQDDAASRPPEHGGAAKAPKSAPAEAQPASSGRTYNLRSRK